MFRQYWGLEEVPGDFPPCVLTIGNFDGIHIGHQKILDAALEQARQAKLRSAALIFDPHPLTVVRPEHAPALLTQPAERLQRFADYGLDTGVVLRFTPSVARLSPEEFVQQVLVDKLRVRCVVVGENFRFGHRQSGDFRVLAELGEKYGFAALAVPAVSAGGELVSSTRIRELVRQGRVEKSRRLLGRPFTLQGSIQPGHGIGSKRTVPTLNLAPESELLPARGVYITETQDRESKRCWKSVTNVGCRPTFDGTELSVETHLLSPLEGAAPVRIELSFYRRLRDERRFESAESLREQILADAEQAARFFRRWEAAGRKRVKVS